MSDPKAVFLSYASDDAAAAQRIADALREAAITVWFDKDELRGGDAWDASIRQQIRSCALFVPIISASTEARPEGYFRREWNLAADRTLDMAHGVPFIVPVAIDGTNQKSAMVPDKFQSVQWTRLPQGNADAPFVAHVRRLLGAGVAPSSIDPAGDSPASAAAAKSRRNPAAAYAALAIVLLATLAGGAYVLKTKRDDAPPPILSVEPSIAVLPFADMSERHDQAYFADGMAEELINRLSQTPELKVIARTSSFQFRGSADDVRSIAAKLAVANLIEGSIRRSGTLMRITVQLVRAADGVHIWSQSYDRNERDALKVQDEIADSVAKALSVSLHLDSSNSPPISEAYTLYLRAREKSEHSGHTEASDRAVIAMLEQAVQQDPQLGMAWAFLSKHYQALGQSYPEAPDGEAAGRKARDAADRAMQLAPQLAESHLARARMLAWFDWDWSAAEAEMQRALALGPGNAVVHRNAYYVKMMLGQWDKALQLATRATELDPLSVESFTRLGDAQLYLKAFPEAESAYRRALKLDPEVAGVHGSLAQVLFYEGKKDEAKAEVARETERGLKMLLEIYFAIKTDRSFDASKALQAAVERYGRTRPFELGTLYADIGQRDEAFRFWERAVAEHNTSTPNLLQLTRDPDLVGIESDPRFKALARAMKLPSV